MSYATKAGYQIEVLNNVTLVSSYDVIGGFTIKVIKECGEMITNTTKNSDRIDNIKEKIESLPTGTIGTLRTASRWGKTYLYDFK